MLLLARNLHLLCFIYVHLTSYLLSMVLLPTCCFSFACLPVCGIPEIYHWRIPDPPSVFEWIYFMPVSSVPSICHIIQSTAIRKIIGDSTQPACLTHVFTPKDSVSFPVVDYLACSIVV
uniref:Uncharacterized protein n=1 Tax=Trichobilharzia regenti TaxID=157069 RepID=A0AA85JBQ6_TRIRE|nr:unnamed protein product [Trichobilharzia regenti]